MKYKKIIMVLVLTIFIFGVASVCASDVDDTVIAGENDAAIQLTPADSGDIISAGENEEIMSDGNAGTFSELQSNISATASGSTLLLTKDYKCENNFTGGIIINESITVDGNGYTLDAQGISRIFKVTADNVTLKNINFINAQATRKGGAVCFDMSGTVTDCNFTNNKATYVANFGGAICMESGTITNCNFVNNTALYGGAVYLSEGNITNCNFTDNKATGKGGAINIYSSFVTGCNFVNNSAGDGGAILMYSGSVENCKFIDNTAKYGGAVYLDENATGEIKDCDFTDNTAECGGAVYFFSNGTVTDCNFANNSAKLGGAIDMDSGSLINCNFANNNATDGGAVYLFEGADLTGCNFTDNNATGKGGAVYVDGDFSNSEINSLFINNSAKNGGAIYFNGEMNNVTVNGCFKGNGAERAGGAIFVRGKSGNNNFSAEFYGNRANQASGGAIFFSSLAENNGFESVFMDNYALYGGAVFFYNKANDNEFNSEFINNTAKSCGGAMFFYNTTNNNAFAGSFIGNHALGEVDASVGNGGAITFKDTSSNNVFTCDFVNNTAALNGGGVNFRHTPYNITFNSDFINNTSPSGGGVNFFESFENVTFNGKFINNSATSGGAIFVLNLTNSKISSTFINNSASNGGALYFNGKVDNVTIDSYFEGNDAERAGGAIFVRGQALNNNFSSEFYGNKARQASGGAIIFRNLAENNTFEGIFEDNYALYGGAIFFYNKANRNKFSSEFMSNVAKSCGGAMFFYNTTDKNNFTGYFFNNTALGQVSEDGNGGAITFKNTSSNSIFTCDFVNNTAAKYGGAVNYRQTPYNITFNSDFINNNALTGGGVNFFESFENVIFNGEFIANSAVKGGAITAGEGVIKDVSFKDNHAENGGAVYFKENGTVENCNFIANYAIEDGGAIYYDENSTGEVIGCNFTKNKGISEDSSGGAICFYNDSIVTDCNFADNSADEGGAVNMDFGCLTNCNFVNNTATGYGGAVYRYMRGNITNCNFTNNTATYSGGAIYSADQVTILNCNFNGNEANSGSALDLWQKEPAKISIISHSTFLNNKANVKYEAFESKMNGSNLEITFMGYDNLLNAIYSSYDKVNFTNVTYWGADGIANTDSFTPAVSTGEAGQNITVKGVVNGNVIDTVMVTDADGKIVLEDVADYWITVRHDEDSYYSEAEKTISNMTLNVNVTSQTTTNMTVNITAKSNIFNEVMPGSLLFILPDGNKINATYTANGTWWAEYTFEDCDVYSVNASYVGLDNVTVNNATITVEKINTSISVDDKIDMEVGKIVEINATLTPADAGNLTYVSSNESVIKLSGNLIVSVGKGTANVTVSFAGNDMYAASNKTVTVTVSLRDVSVSVENATLNLKTGDTFDLNATADPDLLDVQYVSSNESVVRVTDEGIVTAVGAGTATISLTVGDGIMYAFNTTNVTVNVKRANTTILAEDFTQYACDYYEGERGGNFTFRLVDENGNPVANKTIYIGYNGVTLKRTTDANGSAAVQINLKNAGLYTFVIVFLDDDGYHASMAVQKVTIKKKTTSIAASAKTFKATAKTKKYTVTLKTIKGASVNGKTYLEAGKIVTLKINGKTYTGKTNAKGQVTFSLKITKKGKFAAVIKYAGDVTYKESSKKVKITIK
ncbi:MAG: Ig-like domain-containing protein [Methanobrevibacter sp.]|nr:Ig-like domain-containing protein [Methanobrevibacter sp.]